MLGESCGCQELTSGIQVHAQHGSKLLLAAKMLLGTLLTTPQNTQKGTNILRLKILAYSPTIYIVSVGLHPQPSKYCPTAHSR